MTPSLHPQSKLHRRYQLQQPPHEADFSYMPFPHSMHMGIGFDRSICSFNGKVFPLPWAAVKLTFSKRTRTLTSSQTGHNWSYLLQHKPVQASAPRDLYNIAEHTR